MGLDQWCYSCDADDIPNQTVDFSRPESSVEIAYWRKHPDLHGWMEDLYIKKGGSDPDFNCAAVELTIDDLDNLQMAIEDRKLPYTQGFFFGESSGDNEEMKYDLDFVRKAKDLIVNQDKRIFYTSWW